MLTCMFNSRTLHVCTVTLASLHLMHVTISECKLYLLQCEPPWHRTSLDLLEVDVLGYNLLSAVLQYTVHEP